MSKALTQDIYTWYRRYPGRALSGMKGLNPEQRGVYGTIIDLCYDRRGPLTDDDVGMARECDCDVRRYRRIKAELLALKRIVVDVENGLIYDERAVRELVAAGMYSESQAERARATNKKSTAAPKKRAKRDRPDDKAEVLQNLQDLGQTVGPKSLPRSLKENGKTEANRKSREEDSSTESAAPQAPPPSPSIGGGGASKRRAQQRKPTPDENIDERRAALEAKKREQARLLGLDAPS